MNRTGAIPMSVVMCVLVLMTLPMPALSQTSAAVGYQALHLPENWVPVGVNFDVAREVSGNWSIVGEFGVANEGGDSELDFDGYNIFNIGGGVRWSLEREGPVPFAQLLAGVQLSRAETDRDTAFMLQPGAGVHLPLNDRWGLSAQFDYRPVFYREETTQEVRFVIGARWTRP